MNCQNGLLQSWAEYATGSVKCIVGYTWGKRLSDMQYVLLFIVYGMIATADD
jgi:hypothetical protein